LAPVNKVYHVYTIARVAEMLGEDEDWLCGFVHEFRPSSADGFWPTLR
jgi:hypothetical protein